MAELTEVVSGGPAAVTIHSGLATILCAYLGGSPAERGGLLVGSRAEDWLDIVGAIFPAQRMSAPARCSFDTYMIDVVRWTIDVVRESTSQPGVESILGWVHSHPWHGVYLSEQDLRTLSSWTGLDATAVAMVVDPHAEDARIGIWGKDAVRRELVDQITDARQLTMPGALELAEQLRVPPAARPLLWDLVCCDGVVSVIPKTVELSDAGEPAGVEEAP